MRNISTTIDLIGEDDTSISVKIDLVKLADIVNKVQEIVGPLGNMERALVLEAVAANPGREYIVSTVKEYRDATERKAES